MPNRYEREIEEILRNLDNSESRTTKGPRFGQRSRRGPSDYNRRPRGFPSIHLRPVDWFLVIAVVTALGARHSIAIAPSSLKPLWRDEGNSSQSQSVE